MVIVMMVVVVVMPSSQWPGFVECLEEPGRKRGRVRRCDGNLFSCSSTNFQERLVCRSFDVVVFVVLLYVADSVRVYSVNGMSCSGGLSCERNVYTYIYLYLRVLGIRYPSR